MWLVVGVVLIYGVEPKSGLESLICVSLPVQRQAVTISQNVTSQNVTCRAAG